VKVSFLWGSAGSAHRRAGMGERTQIDGDIDDNRRDQMVPEAKIVDAVILVRVPRVFRPGMSDVALYEATRGVWRIGPRRDKVRYALAVYEGVVQEVYELAHWQRAGTTPYQTRKFDNAETAGRWEFVGNVASEAMRRRYVGKSVRSHFSRGAQNPIAYVNVPT
jgi:hypothetical protein